MVLDQEENKRDREENNHEVDITFDDILRITVPEFEPEPVPETKEETK